MVKCKIVFVCFDCGVEFFCWQGQCMECKVWNIIFEFVVSFVKFIVWGNLVGYVGQIISQVQVFNEINVEDLLCFGLGFKEFDRVFGGGIVLGLVILIGGLFGVGKSILLLQVMCQQVVSKFVLYVIGEELL